jgi:hypothetical protein
MPAVIPSHRITLVNEEPQTANPAVWATGGAPCYLLFKRGVIGSFHKVSAKHLPRYLAEFTYRFNRREEEGISMMTLARPFGKIALPYERLVAQTSE